MTAPTRLRGVVDDTTYDSVLYDILEHIPDLQPGLHAILVYAEMRRDARLAAVESGYTLQLRRAQWQLDGHGCRPEVVQLGADDMGLPVAGEDRPGPARTRGVSWNEHLRASLLMLPYGFMAFEELAEIVDGRARLIALAERMPHTVSDIGVNPTTGALTGITQDAVGPRAKAPQIPADRLVFYANAREGAGWHGRSLFRPAWAPWLLKHELMRINSTSARRFGMGVPVVRALPGTNPTPAQHAAAAEMAQQARVGDQSGAALPPGFVLELVGLSGGTPDVLGYIKWLDTQISSAVLMPHLDLGNTESGSRALASSFLDSWMLALESIAEHIADVATRQIAARIVGWNWGEDEPVPRVVCSGIGSKREVTAESLQLLLSSGALQADPGLESWIRREYRLPEREGMPTVAPSTPTVAASAARQRSPRTQKRREPDGQLELPIAEPDVMAAGSGAGHADVCEEASLTSVCKCGCNGTRHAESRARQRLGAVRVEAVEREGRSVRLAAATDDELAQLLVVFSRDNNWDALGAVDGEMERRERDNDWLDNPAGAEHWDTGGEPTEQDRQVDALLARGYDFVEAYAEVHGKDPERLRAQERSTSVDRSAGESTDAAVRRGYDLWVHEQWLQAEADTRGHLLTREAQAKGVQVVDLFSGPTARARKWASEDLQRWWADNGRLTFTQYRAQVLGRQRDRSAAEATRLGGNDRDFI